jgi:AraC-like DNA-binding protein
MPLHLKPVLNPLPPGKIFVQFSTSRRPWKTRPHAHEGFEFLYIVNGAKQFLLGGELYSARSGDLIIFRPGDVHEEWIISRKLTRVALRCHPIDMAAARAAFPPREKLPPVVRLPWKQRFQNLFSRMSEERTQPKVHSDMLLGAYLMEFVVLLSRAAETLSVRREKGTDDSVRARARSAIELIHNNIDRSLRLDELARSAFMSVSRFSHVFKKEIGQAPKEYLIEERIKRAKKLLATTEMSAQDVAFSLGYDNPLYFYRLFKKKTGMTTRQFVRTARKCI